MKKILALILCAAMLFCVTACNEISENNSSIIETNTSSQETQETSVIESTIDVSNQTVTSDIKTEESSEPLENNTSTQNAESSSEIAENSEPTESSNPDKESKPTEESKPVESSEPEHIHKFSKTTCTEPQKCECGETKGKALGHRFTKATCTTPLTCLVCNATEGEALGHDYYAGECKTCKEENPDWIRITSADGVFSIAVPKSLKHLATTSADSTVVPNNSIDFVLFDLENYYTSFTPVLRIYAEKNEDKKFWNVYIEQGDAAIATTSDDYTILYGDGNLEYVPSGAEGPTKVQEAEISLVLEFQEEILDSIRWE